MSVQYRAVQWNRVKLAYDALLLMGVAVYVSLYQALSHALFRGSEAVSEPIVAMRAWGSCAFLLLSLILSMGPLARLDRRFLPLVYNRRHAGVVMSLVALVHASQVLGFYFAYGKEPELEALFHYGAPSSGGVAPFLPFGIAALLIVLVMACTSHDFWQRFLGPSAWKALHMLVYAAYACVVAHVALGALARERSLPFALVFCAAALTVSVLHVLAARRSQLDVAPSADEAPWVDAGPIDAVPCNHARPVCPPSGERIAIVNRGGLLYAVHGVCAHQRGPLYEGRVRDGCLTCPWHGFQYRPEDGRSPPPFQEELPIYRLRAQGGRLLVDPRPLPAGSAVEPVRSDAVQAKRRQADV